MARGRLVKKTKELVQKAETKTPKRDVTKKQIKRSGRVKASLRTISRRFKEQKITFAPYKEKILLSADDKAERLKFAWVVLEDNDPTGYKSKAAVKAKAEAGIKTRDLPKCGAQRRPAPAPAL